MDNDEMTQNVPAELESEMVEEDGAEEQQPEEPKQHEASASAKGSVRKSRQGSVTGSVKGSVKAISVKGSVKGSQKGSHTQRDQNNPGKSLFNPSGVKPQLTDQPVLGVEDEFLMPQENLDVEAEMMESSVPEDEASKMKKKVTFTGRGEGDPKPRDYSKLRDIPFFELPKNDEDKSGSEEDDNKKLPNLIAGQSNSNKKEKLSRSIKFPDEDSSSQQSGVTGKSGRTGQSKKSAGSQAPLDFADEAVEQRAKPEFERFFPVFKEVYKLRELQQQGYKAKGTDFFMAYLKGMKEADEQREAERKKKDQQFFEQIRKVVEFQDKRTKELMDRMALQEARRKEILEERLAEVGEVMLDDYKRNKEAAKKARAVKKQNEQAYQVYLQKMGFNPTALTQAPMPLQTARPIWELQPKGVKLQPGRG